METQISILSDGTSHGTQVLDGDGNIIRGVQKVTWTADIDTNSATVVMEIKGVSVNVKGKNETQNKE